MKIVVKKSVYDEIMLEKSFRGYPVGTIREWNNIKYRKTAPNKWQRIYETKNESANIDTEYFNAIKSGDMEKVQKMVNERAEKMGFKDAIPEQGNGYKIRVTRPPKKTKIVYKCFFVDTHGKPSALFVDNNASLPMNVWLNANDTFHFTDENGNAYVPTMGNATNKDAGKTGISVKIPNEDIKKELIKRGYLPEGSNAKNITCVAYRPGWHGGDLPFFPQGGKKDINSNYGNVHRWNQVIFEIEIDADKDYTHEAKNQEKAKNKDGTLNLKKADLQYMPEGGFYQYTTNPTVKQQTNGKGDWFISGSIKIKRALTQKECNDILQANGMKEQEWEGGEMDLSKLGYTKPDFDAARKTLAPITYDDNGKIIPLSQRFNKDVDDIRKSLTWSGYKLQGRTTFNGLNISIENKKGSVRRGVDDNGHKWAVKMNYDYGYIRGTEGVDGDHLDCYLGDNEDTKFVYIVHQNNPDTNEYDEDKCMLGFNTLADAKEAYLSQYDRPGFLGKIDVMEFEKFKDYVLSKNHHGKRIMAKSMNISEYMKSVKKSFNFDMMKNLGI